MTKIFDYLIIGAGISGTSFARYLQLKKPEKTFIILESEGEPGGLCRTKNISGNYLDIGGGHFLCSKYLEVYNFIFQHIPESSFNYFSRVSKIRIENEVIDYPIESNIFQLPINLQIDYLISIIQSGENTSEAEPTNYEEYIIWKLGKRIAEKYMIPYNTKIWGISPQEMDVDWLYKIPRLDVREIILSCLQKRADPSKMPSHVGFYYPKTGGFQEIFNAIYRFIEPHVILYSPVTSIKKEINYFSVNNEYKAKKIINTAPWPKLIGTMNIPKKIMDYIKSLKYSSIVVSLWQNSYGHNYHWLYDPDMNYEPHREFFINNFAPHSIKDWYYTETNLKRWPGINKNWKNGQQPFYEHSNEFAYPIPSIGRKQSIHTILEYFRKIGIFGLGRWGQWEYFNADVCILEAMKLFNELENDTL